MKNIFTLMLLGILGVFISACSSTPELLVTPVPDKLTFLFFYTDGWVPWGNMEPIVDGLEQQYQEEIAFFSINAGTDGRDTFSHYNLLGHPGYVLLNPDGDVLWSGVGELLLDQIDGVLKRQTLQIDW